MPFQKGHPHYPDKVRKPFKVPYSKAEKNERQRQKYNATTLEQRRNYKLKDRYGITYDQYLDLAKAQNNVCAVCDNLEPQKALLSVDHDHTTGVVRGLLCTNCNLGIGYAQDSIDILEKMIEYLKLQGCSFI